MLLLQLFFLVAWEGSETELLLLLLLLSVSDLAFLAASFCVFSEFLMEVYQILSKP
jgi:hypothetical protein